MAGLEGYGDDLIEWPETNLQLKNSNRRFQGLVEEDVDEEAEGIQSKERWAYVKVNMDGVMVGRKICILDHCGYSSLASQLEDMFGRNQLYLESHDLEIFFPFFLLRNE